MIRHYPDGTVLEVTRNLLDVTSLSRPDTAWRFTDSAGHEHRWFANGEPAQAYDPTKSYDVPTTEVVASGPWYWDEDLCEFVRDSIRRCIVCHQEIDARTKPDDDRQFIQGLTRATINGSPASREEVEALIKKWGDE